MPQLSNTNGGKLRPKFFLVRKKGKSGEVVPLIAVDELPPTCNLVGVPRTLDLEETISMLNLGPQPSISEYYQVIQENKSICAGSSTQ